jgi:dTDP-L-rhamnose 4-epimerase
VSLIRSSTPQTTRVLLTGGAGFIGCALSRRLVAGGASVTVVDSLHPQVHAGGGRPAALPAEVDLVPFDVTTASTWDALLGLVRPEVVVHLAAETGTGQSLRESTRHCHVNVLGTAQMLDAFSRADFVPPHIVLPSSRAVYGEGEWELDGTRYLPGARRHADLAAGRWDPVCADQRAGRALPSRAAHTPPNPTNVYAATKLAQEHICAAWAASMGTALSILRFQNVYGVGQSLANPYTGVLALFTRLAVTGKPIEVYEDGRIVRDFVYVDDVVDAVMRAIERPPREVRCVDIGSGSPRTLLSVAELIADIAGGKPPVVTGAFRDGDVRSASCSIDDARAELGYEPAWDLADGVKALARWTLESLEYAPG